MQPTSIKLSAEMLKDLKSVAQTQRRSVSFIIRDSITFWLGEHRRRTDETEGQKAGNQISPQHSELGIL
jgi:predicted transcriptional regulator